MQAPFILIPAGYEQQIASQPRASPYGLLIYSHPAAPRLSVLATPCHSVATAAAHVHTCPWTSIEPLGEGSHGTARKSV
jgi:hypothetical protein